MKQTIKRPIDQAIVFNAGAVREDLKQGWEGLEFWTCSLDLHEYPEELGLAPSLRRGCAFMTEGNLQVRLQEVLDWKEEILKEDSMLAKLPYASLTIVVARKSAGSTEGEVYKKLCEITAGEINPESYKALQSFMFDLQLNVNGWFEGWWNNREDERWLALL